MTACTSGQVLVPSWILFTVVLYPETSRNNCIKFDVVINGGVMVWFSWPIYIIEIVTFMRKFNSNAISGNWTQKPAKKKCESAIHGGYVNDFWTTRHDRTAIILGNGQ